MQLDLAKVMAEMFKLGDKNKDEVLELAEFKAGMVEHPVTGKILREKTLDSLLATMWVICEKKRGDDIDFDTTLYSGQPHC